MRIPPFAPGGENTSDETITLPEGTITFETGSMFNQPLILPSTLRHITFGPSFNQPVEFNAGVQSISFGDAFDHPVTVPPSCSVVNVSKHYKHNIDGLHEEPGSTVKNHLGPHKSAPVSLYGDKIKKVVEPRDTSFIGADSMSSQQTDSLLKAQQQART
jgi:hypothetical protein